MAGCNELTSEQPVTEIYNVLSIWTLKNACQRDRFHLGVITSDLSSLAALGLRSVSNEPAPGLRVDVCGSLLPPAWGVPWGHADVRNTC